MYFAESSTIKIDITELLQNLVDLYFEHDYDTVSKVLKIENVTTNHRHKTSYRYQRGMTFSKEKNLPITVRIYIDNETRNYLNVLTMITSNIINERQLIDLIVSRWLEKVGIFGTLKDEIPEFDDNKTFAQFTLSKNVWDELSTACKNKGITLKIGFKMSLLDYINTITL